MRSVKLIALSQFKFEDIAPFLSWLKQAPEIQRTAAKMKIKPPVGSGKLTPMLKALSSLKLINLKQECFTLSVTGDEFLLANPATRKAMVRTIFLTEDEIKKIVTLLNASSRGRIAKYMANECLASGGQESTSETEVLALLAWAEQVELFGYDAKKHEIFSLESGKPKATNHHVAA